MSEPAATDERPAAILLIGLLLVMSGLLQLMSGRLLLISGLLRTAATLFCIRYAKIPV